MYLDDILCKGHLEVSADLQLLVEDNILSNIQKLDLQSVRFEYLQTAALAQNPQNDQLILLVEGDAVEFVQIFEFHHFQLKHFLTCTECLQKM